MPPACGDGDHLALETVMRSDIDQQRQDPDRFQAQARREQAHGRLPALSLLQKIFLEIAVEPFKDRCRARSCIEMQCRKLPRPKKREMREKLDTLGFTQRPHLHQFSVGAPPRRVMQQRRAGPMPCKDADQWNGFKHRSTIESTTVPEKGRPSGSRLSRQHTQGLSRPA